MPVIPLVLFWVTFLVLSGAISIGYLFPRSKP